MKRKKMGFSEYKNKNWEWFGSVQYIAAGCLSSQQQQQQHPLTASRHKMVEDDHHLIEFLTYYSSSYIIDNDVPLLHVL